MNDKKNETSLIDLAIHGNQKAYKKLFEMNASSLFRFMMQFSANREEVNDWVQESFIQAFKSLEKFSRKSSFKTWLFKIALNKMRESKSLVWNQSLEPFENYFDIPTENISLEISDHLFTEIEKLEPIKKSVLILYEVEEYSHDEISELLGITSGQSRIILFLTKQQLKIKLKENLN